ncbi:MAG: hypothetical protein IPL18_11985 [Sphingomonadales bacterium]|nr:hypothetical protein [Sphingomonadales bacterium]
MGKTDRPCHLHPVNRRFAARTVYWNILDWIFGGPVWRDQKVESYGGFKNKSASAVSQANRQWPLQ